MLSTLVKLFLNSSEENGAYYSSRLGFTADFLGIGDVNVKRTNGKGTDSWAIWLNDLEVDFETLPTEVWLNPKNRGIYDDLDKAKASLED
jgi:glyoxylase-like metal-dependent hydrolase (beta-lactamase superfamily II)